MPRHVHRADAGPIGVRVARGARAALILAAITASLGFATSGGQQAPPPPVAAAAPPSEPAATPRPSPADTAPTVRVPVVRATPGSGKRTTPPTEVLYPRLDLAVPVVPTGVTGDGQMEIPGDAATAGYLIARAQGDPPAARLSRAVAYGTAAVALPGTAIPAPDQVRVPPDAVRRL